MKFLDKHSLDFLKPQVFSPEDDFLDFFQKEGYVVLKNVSTKENLDKLLDLISNTMHKDIKNKRRLGFLDIYHDNILAKIRQCKKMTLAFEKIFGKKLWVVFDRIIFIKAGEKLEELPAHIDQNMIKNKNFFNVQGLLALKDMNMKTGTIALVPKSHLWASNYKEWTKEKDGFIDYKGNESLAFKAIELKEGEIVIWDSRTTHSRYLGSLEDRYSMMISYVPAVDNEELRKLRIEQLKKGTGLNNHEAGLRATANPRCEVSLRNEEENLDSYGRLIYGLDSWFKE